MSSSSNYTILSEASALLDAVSRFHEVTDGLSYKREAIYPTSGSSPLLFAFFLRLANIGCREVYYAPPIYYSCFYFARMLGISLIPVTDEPALPESAPLRLPDKKTVMLFCDPIWVFGVPVAAEHFDALKVWQQRTESTILVDGTFQYSKWDERDRQEQSSLLEPELTFRLVCPTKSLSVHGVRFAYMLLPPDQNESIRYPCSNITGSTPSSADAAATSLMEQLLTEESNYRLLRYVQKRFRRLQEEGFLLPGTREPIASYYCFAKLSPRVANDTLKMDQRFFGIKGWEDFVRVNILAPYWEDLIADSTLDITDSTLDGPDHMLTG
ncbi:aspartate/methionine/tyrosine aminotransferase [Actinomycetospora cinnamomea]|uniref:Aspartate/methionine/tyrosine aminotransferase n=1 Tax=Actinomycetospora cinnamomea TaxID=663609 RepID=A0A2U1F7R4_9PSEU|nr:aspartate/methionine/tyrosine aminotransferase [Actinomycetospora cinnamomea]